MHTAFINRLTELVEANLANETFGIEDISREMGMSHSSLHRKLRSASNQNISQFIREIRLKKAKELLQNEDLTVAEISYRVGFASPTYFNKCFHEFFGCTPGELRNHKQETETEQQVVAVPEKRKRSRFIIIFILCALLLIPLFFFLINRVSQSKAEPIPDKSIAVLPFKYLGDETEKQYLADGTMDAILLQLSKIKDLRVVSRTSVEQYRNTNKTIKTIGQELDVSYILEGSFQKNDDRIRLILQLIKTSDDGHAWSGEYDREWKDVFSVQSDVSETVASELNVLITPEEKQMIRKAPTTDLTAYDFYQRGRDLLDNKDDSVSWEKAQKLFKKALERDSTFALAYTGLADIYWSKYYWKTFLSKNFLDSVIILTSKSLVLDHQCDEAYYLRGAAYLNIDKISEAFKELDKAIEYNPNNWKAYSVRSFILGGIFQDFVGAISNKNEAILRNRGSGLPGLLSDLGTSFGDIGFPELGKKYFQQALELTGDSTEYLYRLRWLENSLGNFEKAYQLAKTIYNRDPNRVSSDMAIYCAGAGHDKEAIYYYEKLAKQFKKSGEIDLYASKEVAYSFWQAGRKQEAKHYFDQQIKIGLESIKMGRWNSIQKGAHFDLAEVYAFLGDKEKAYYYLDEVNNKKSFPLWWVTLFKYHPLFNSIRHEPRFQKILKDVEGKYQAEHERVSKWLAQNKML